MTDFKLSWTIENKYLPIHIEMSTKEVGYSFTTPSLGQECAEDCYKADHNFSASLLFSSDLPEQVGNGSLVVKVHLERMEQKNVNEEFSYTEPRFIFYGNSRHTWHKADNYTCDTMIGGRGY